MKVSTKFFEVDGLRSFVD